MRARYLLATFVLGLLPILALFAATSQAAQMTTAAQPAPDLSPARVAGSRFAGLEPVVSATVAATGTLGEDLSSAPNPSPAPVLGGATTDTTSIASDPTLTTTGATTQTRGEVPEATPAPLLSAAQPEGVLAGDRADLTIEKTVTPSSASPGSAITYTLVYTNSGPLEASGVVITDDIPGSLTGVDFDRSGPDVTATVGSQYVWQVQDLAPDQSGVITITAVISPDISLPSSLDNTARITSTVADTATADNQSTAVVTVVLPDLYIEGSARPLSLLPGEAVTYTLVYGNRGPSVARGVAISDAVPAVVEDLDYASDPPLAAGGSFSYTWLVGDLPAEASGVITISGVVGTGTAYGTTFVNVAEISSATPDGETADNSSAAAVKVKEHVLAVEPAGNVHTASVHTDLTVTVSASVSETSVTTGTWRTHGGFRGRLGGSYQVDAVNGDGQMVFDPDYQFGPGELVESSVTEGVEAGGAPLEPFVWQFRSAVLGGSGRFTDSGAELGTGTSYRVALGDLDGDGNLDAFVANSGGANTTWFGDGSGSFGTGQSLGNASSRAVALGDLDGDGDLDAFVANASANQVWLNGGAGQFSPGQSLAGGTSLGVALGDLDADGDLDAFVANSGANEVWLNDGDGGFADSEQSLGSAESYDVALGDLDADGDLDAVVANWELTGAANAVWLNDGQGGFPSAVTFGDKPSRGLALGDVDGDGWLDAFVANYSMQANRVWLNDGTGGLVDSNQSLGNASSLGVALGDLDGDGDLDAFVANVDFFGGGAPNKVWLNDGGNFEDSGQDLGSAISRGAALGDVDGDGDLDAFVANYDPNRVWLNESRSDLSLSKSVDSTSALPGQRITYTIVYTNHGPQVARNVVITDPVPPSITNTSYVTSGAAAADTGAAPYVWDVEDLAPGQVGTIQVSGLLRTNLPAQAVFTNTATITATLIDTDTADNRSQAAVTVVKPVLGLVKTVTPEVDVAYHGEVTYTLVLSNGGDGDGHATVLTDPLPAEVAFTRWAPGGKPPGASRTGNQIDWTGTVTAGRAVTLTFVANHTGGYSEEVLNTAYVSQTFAADDASATFTVIQPPVLAITKEATPTVDVAYHGEVTYTVVLSNDGVADAFGTQVTDTLSPLVAFARWVPGGRPKGAGAQDGEITWTGTVTAGQAVTFSFVVAHTGYYSEVVNNTVDFAHASGQNSDGAEFTVVAPPHLGISKAVTPTSNVAYHGEVTYTVVLTNDGVANAYNTQLRDALPPQVVFARWLPEGQPDGAVASSSEITWEGTVDAGAAVTFTFVATHTGYYLDEVTNTAQFTHASGFDSDAAAFTVIAPPELVIEKAATPATDVAYHGEVTYTVVLSNDGVANAYGTLLTDALPSQVDFARWLPGGQPESATVSEDVVTWTGTVEAGAAVEFSFVVSHTGDYSDLVANTVEFSHVSDQDSDTATFQVLDPPDLVIAKQAHPVAVLPGQALTYTLHYSNAGPSPAHGVLISDRLPAGFAAADYSPTGATVTPTGSFSYTWDVADLLPGDDGAITIMGVVSTGVAYGTVFTNAAEITAATPDGDSTDNRGEAAVKVRERVLGVEPAANVHTATVDTDLTITLGAPADIASVSTETLFVHGGFQGRVGTGLSVIDTDDHAEILIDPDTDFKPGELVEATATDGIVTGGAPLVPHVWRFRAAVLGGTGVFYDSDNALGTAFSYDVALGDLDGDGDLDAFVVNSPNQGNRVWLNDSLGRYADSGQSLGVWSSQAVALGDLDGDGDLDAYVANYLQGNRVWLNNGNAEFTNPAPGLGTGASLGVALGDVDGDGDLDAFVANDGANRLWLNDGAGSFDDSEQTLGVASSYDVALGDLDDDGDLDAFVANRGSNSVWLNEGGSQWGILGVFGDSGQALGSASSAGVALGDVDGDGDLDAAVANYQQDSRLWLNRGNGTYDSDQSLGDAASFGLALGDIDADEDLDLFIANKDLVLPGAPNTVYVNNGLGLFTDTEQSLGESASLGAALGDVDGDGDLDAFIANAGQSNRVWLNGSRTDLSITKSVEQDLVVPRGPITYTLEYRNDGPQVARGVRITDVVPVSITHPAFAPTGGEVTATGGITFAWQVQDLWPGDSRVITVTGVMAPDLVEGMRFSNTAEITAAVVDPDLTDNKSYVGVTVVEPALAISKTVMPAEGVVYHSAVTYTVVLSNGGNGDALGVVLTDELPSSVEFAHWVGKPAGAVEEDGEITWLGNVAAGQVVTFTFVATHTGSHAEVVANSAEYDHWSGPGSAQASFKVLDPPDLQIEKTVDQEVLLPGDQVIYTLVYSNAGPSVARGVVISDPMPVTVTQVISASEGATITPTGTTKYGWDVEDLSTGEGGVITITGVVQQPLPAGLFTNTATIASTTPDGDSTDNVSQAAVQVIVPALSMTKSAVPGTKVTYHGLVTYTLVVSNGGVGDALGVVVTDELPAQVEFDRWLTSSGGDVTGNRVTWTGTVTAGQAVSLSFVVRHTGEYSDVVLNEAEFQHWSGFGSAGAEFEVVGPPDLYIEKAVQPAVLLPGDPITYTLVYGNRGPSVARGVVISDLVPVTVTQVVSASKGATLTPTGTAKYRWQVQDLPTGEGGVITITGVVVQPLPAGVFTNTATIESTTPDDDPADNESEAGVQVVVPALSMSKAVTPVANVAYHGLVTYTLELSNGGEGDALGVMVTDELPAEVEFAGWGPGGQPEGATEEDGVISWQTSVGSGQAMTFTYLARHTGYYEDVATNAAEYEHWSGTGEAAATFTVIGLPGLVIEKAVSQETGVVYHSEVTYTVVLSNEGEGAALGVLLVDDLPAQVEFARWAEGGKPPGAVQDEGLITWIGALPAGDAVTLMFVVRHVGAHGDVVTNLAEFHHLTGSGQEDAIFTVLGLPGLSIEKTAGVASSLPGEMISYTLEYANTGPSEAHGVVITDIVPVSLTQVSYASSDPTVTPVGDVTYTWLVGDVGTGEGGVITITGVLSLPLPAGVFTNSASITSTTPDEDLTDNISEAAIEVVVPVLSAIKSVAPEVDVAYHGQVTYTLVLSNGGMGDALGLVLTDALPAGVEFAGWVAGGHPADATEADNVITWKGTLAAGEALTFTFGATHTGGYADEVTNRADYAHWSGGGEALATFTVIGPPQLSIDKTVTPEVDVGYHEEVTYTVVVGNGGGGVAYDVRVTDTLPPGADFVNWTPGGRPVGAGEVGGNLYWSGTLTAGQHVTLEFVARHVGNYADVVVNTARYGHISGSGSDAATFTVIGPPQLSIDKTVTPEVDVGYHEEVTYTVVVGNGGGGVAYGVRVTDTLPPEVDFVGWAPGGQPAGASEDGDGVYWAGPLAAGEDVTLEFVARHVGNYADVVVNTARYGHISGGGTDAATFTVIGPPQLSIEKTVTPEVDVGYHEDVTYTLVMANGGGGVAYGVRLTDTLPPQVDFVGWAPGGQPAGASELGDEIYWDGTLAAGQDVTLEFVARHVGTYADVVVNTAEYDHISDSGSDAASFTVVGPPEFSISKAVVPKVNVAYHGQVAYTVVLSNTGPGVAYDVVFTDLLPAEVEFVTWLPGGRPDGAEVVEGEIGWLGTLGSGEAATFIFVARHVGYYGEVVTNRAEYGHWTSAGGYAETNFSVIGPPQLSIDKTVVPEVDVGYHEEVTYTLVMGNGGGGVAYGVRVTDTLPPEAEFVGWAPGGQPAGASELGDEVRWEGTLAAGQDVTLEFVARHVGNYADLVVNTAQYDHISDSGSDVASFTVVGPPEFSISKVVTPEVGVAYHGLVTYTAVLSNAGPGVAYGLAFTDPLPAEVEFEDWAPGGQPDGADLFEGEIGWVGTLGSGESVTFGYVARHVGYYGELVTNRAEYAHWVTAGGYAEATFGVIEPPALSIRKTVTPELDLAIHSEVTYTIVLSNDGVADAEGTVLNDTLPPQVEFARWATGGPPAGAGEQDNEVTWSGTVYVGLPITLTFVATHTGNYADVVVNRAEFNQASGTGGDEATFVVRDPPDLLIVKTVSPTAVLPGDPITYTIAFSNTGPSPATEVIIDDEIPGSLHDLSDWTSEGVAATGTYSYTWLVQDLPPGAGGLITVTGIVSTDVEYGIWITNTATITSAMPDGAPADNESHVGIKVWERIVDVEPPSNVHTASVTANVGATTIDPVEVSSVTTRTFSVHGFAQGHLDGDFLWGTPGGEGVVFDPARQFFPGEWVETTVTEAVVAGTAPVVRHVWRFRAAAAGGTGEFEDSDQDLGTMKSRAVALGDLDGDGDLDAFVANDGQADEVWRNEGRGDFTNSLQSLGTGAGRTAALADLDGDGDLDAVVTNWQQPNDVWLNDGTGVFVPGASLGNGQSQGVALGDLDGDGDLDAYVVNYNEANLVWLNDGPGGFVDSGQALGSARSYGVRLADLDDDGDLDALVANYGDASRVWLNDSTGHFESGPELGSTTSYDVALGDLDGDGDLDAYFANFNKPDRVWWNDGGAVFADSMQSLGGNAYSQRVALGDVDGDDDLDAFVANYFGQADRVFLNDGTGAFYPTAQALGASYGYGVDLGDLDGDGDLDAYVANGSSQLNRVWLNVSWSDLSVVKSAAPSLVGLDQTVTYTLVYANNGPHRATDVVISDDIPDTLQSVAYTHVGASIVEVGPDPYTWEVEDLEPGDGGVITITGIVDDQSTGVFSLTNQVLITHTRREVEPLDNSSEASITVDAEEPARPALIEPAYGAVVSDTTPLFRWQASASSDVGGYLLKLDGETVDVGDVTQHIPPPLDEGVHNWTVAAYDRAGNVSLYVMPWSFTLDSIPPGPPQLISPRDGALISDTTPALTWLGSPDPDVAGYLLKWDGGLLDLGDVTQHTPAPQADGLHTWTLAAYDGARNTGAYTDVWSLMLDATPPEIQATQPANGAVDVRRPEPVVITFTEPVEASSFAFNVTPDPGSWVAQWDGTGSVVTLDHADYELGFTYAVTVTAAVDRVGLPLAQAPYSWSFTTKDIRIFLPAVVRNP